MNTGMQDAANLGWKLAAAVQGWAPDSLLDTYQSERHPVGRAVLRGSGTLLRLALAQSPATRAARGLVKAVFGRLGRAPSQVAHTVSGIAIAYPKSRRDHPLTGQRAPDVRLRRADEEPGRLYEALRVGEFVLVTHDGHTTSAAAWRDRVVTVAVDDPMPASMALVRPDGYVAWATDESSAAALDADAREAFLRWCGPSQASG